MTQRFASSLSTETASSVAIDEAVGGVAASLDGATPDLVVAFCSSHHTEAAADLVAAVDDRLSPGAVVGCTAEAVVGDGREVEEHAGIALWAAVLPGARIEPFRCRFFRNDQRAGFAGMPDPLASGDTRAVILFADPFSFPADALLRYAADRFPGVAFTGGMASGATRPGGNRLFFGRDVVDDGAVGIVVSGDVRLRMLVSQGCKPVGAASVVTAAQGNVLLELGGRPATDVLQEVIEELSPDDRMRAQRGIHLGIAVDEYREDFRRGDFIIRAIFRADPRTGALEVGDVVEVGRTVRFHVRDADSADEDLRDLLAEVDPLPESALLFTCNGRGSRLFVMPDHDAQALQGRFGDAPVAGLFCQGEIGPVGGRSFLHGFTASAALFG